MRFERVQEIFKKCKELKHNETTIVFLLATMNDKALGKFHAEYMAKEATTA